MNITSRRIRIRLTMRPILMAAVVLALLSPVWAQSPNLVISQIYGGGGATAGSPAFNQDYVEIFNHGSSAVDLSTWSVQYADALGTNWSKTDLAGMIGPGQYVLVGEAIGTAGSPLPVAVDLGGTIDLSATAGKVALVSNQIVLPSQACFDQGFSGVVDIVGYGQGANATNCAEVAPAPTLTNVLAEFRAQAGCFDSNNNSADFAASAPLPRNSATPLNPCAPTGACCTSNHCSITTQANCTGTYLGDYSICGITTFGSGGAFNTPLIDISTTGTPGPAQGHNVLSDILDLPFTFNFFDVPRTQFRYSTNGWLTFDLTQTDSAPNNPASLPNPGAPNLTIAPFWDELVSDTTGPNQIFIQTVGTAPNRQFIIQYNNVLKFNSTQRYTFEVILWEGADQFGLNRMEFRYSQYSEPAAGDAAIGYEDIAGQTGRNHPLNTVSVGLMFYYTPADVGRCLTRACCRGASCLLTNQVSCQAFGGSVTSNTTCSPSPCSSGACCLPSGTCQILSPAVCATQNGLYRGDATDCQAACPPNGACCAGNGSGTCTIRAQVVCESGGGTWAGAGSTCTTGVCTGACCQTDGTCVDTGPTSCQSAGGTFRGVGSTCATINPPCPPAGACCAPDGSTCTIQTQASCAALGRLWRGAGSNCSACTGACCWREGYCFVGDAGFCNGNGGIFRGVDTNCSISPPCAAAELCCTTSGQCMNLTPAYCMGQGGTPAGPGTYCNQVVYSPVQITPNFVEISQTGTLLIGHGRDDDDAPFDIGFPFSFYTGCVPRTAGRVGVNGLLTFAGPATSYRNGIIPHYEDPNNAIYPLWDDLYTYLGAVYVQTVGTAPNRVCILEWKDVVLFNSSLYDPMTFECKLFEGTNCIEFHYAHLQIQDRSATIGVENETGTSATSIPDSSVGAGPIAYRLCLPQTGACCLNDGTCSSMLQTTCSNLGGVYHGDDSVCGSLNPPCAPFGSCCAEDGGGNCSVRTQADCQAVRGSWGGAGSTCSPNPCTGACCFPGGTCTELGPFTCYNTGGATYNGNGSRCNTLNPPCSQLGACCLGDGTCQLRYDFNCVPTSFRGAGTTCSTDACLGACCLYDGSCMQVVVPTCDNQGGTFRGYGTTCAGSGPCPAFAAVLSGSASGCLGRPHTLTVALTGGTPPYTATLDNGGGTQTGASPLLFSVNPTLTTTYTITSASDSANHPAIRSGSATITIPTIPDCNTNQIADACEFAGIGANQDFSSAGGGVYHLNGNAGTQIIGGACRLTPAVQGVFGTVLFDKVSNLPVTAFTASFDFKIGGGTGADGLSFALMDNAIQSDATAFGEAGPGGNAITAEFNTYQNAGEPSDNFVAVLYNGATLGTYFPTFSLRNNTWNHVQITFNGSAITVILTGAGGAPETAFNALSVPSYIPYVGRYGIGARTGGATDEHWVDNVMFVVTSQTNDCNANNVPDSCEALDPLQFVAVLLELDILPEHRCLADRNRDGSVDGEDVQPYINVILP